jgi:hypothetical protein
MTYISHLRKRGLDMIRNSLAAVAALTMTFASVAANAQAPVRAGAATVEPIALQPIAATSAVRKGAPVSADASEGTGLPIWLLALIAAGVITAGVWAALDKSSSPR